MNKCLYRDWFEDDTKRTTQAVKTESKAKIAFQELADGYQSHVQGSRKVPSWTTASLSTGSKDEQNIAMKLECNNPHIPEGRALDTLASRTTETVSGRRMLCGFQRRDIWLRPTISTTTSPFKAQKPEHIQNQQSSKARNTRTSKPLFNAKSTDPYIPPCSATPSVKFCPRFEAKSKIASELGHLVQWDGTTINQ